MLLEVRAVAPFYKNGFVVASGIYLIEIKAGSFQMVRKVAVVK